MKCIAQPVNRAAGFNPKENPVLPGTYFGTATRVAATGYTAITSANAAIIGIMFNSSGTCALSFYKGATASGSSTVGGLIRANVTVTATIPAAIYYDFPAAMVSGFSVNVPACNDPDVTIFWNPIGGP